MVERPHMSIGDVAHVHVVAYAGSITSIVIGAKNSDRQARACPQLVWRLWNLAAGGSNPNRKENGSESDEERGSVMPVRRDWGFTNQRLSDSWEVGLRRADRWSALDYAMTNGIGSRIFCPAVRAT